LIIVTDVTHIKIEVEKNLLLKQQDIF
jgi:hypothetical protein